MRETLHIIGSGGQAKVVLDTARAAAYDVVALYDDNQARHGETIDGVKIVGGLKVLPRGAVCIVAIGDNSARERVVKQLENQIKFATLVHPSVVLGFGVSIGEGSAIFAGAIIQPHVMIGKHCIINTATSVDHDSQIGDYVHLAPGCRLAGNVTVNKSVFCGVGTVCIPGVQINERAIVGAGSTVIHDLPARVIAVGTPAKPIKPLL